MKNMGVGKVVNASENLNSRITLVNENLREQGLHKQKVELIVRLSRIEGQIRGIKGMIEKDICCDDVLNQVSAVQSALFSAGRLLLFDHVRYCMADKIRHEDAQAIEDLLISIDRLSSLNYK